MINIYYFSVVRCYSKCYIISLEPHNIPLLHMRGTVWRAAPGHTAGEGEPELERRLNSSSAHQWKQATTLPWSLQTWRRPLLSWKPGSTQAGQEGVGSPFCRRTDMKTNHRGGFSSLSDCTVLVVEYQICFHSGSSVACRSNTSEANTGD